MLLAKNNYEEPGPRGSAANFLAGVEMEGDRLGREEVEAGAHYVIINDSNKTVDDDKVDKVKLSKKMLKRRKIYGRSQKRGGNRKLDNGGDGIAYIPPVAPTWFEVALDPDTRVTPSQATSSIFQRRLCFVNCNKCR